MAATLVLAKPSIIDSPVYSAAYHHHTPLLAAGTPLAAHATYSSGFVSPYYGTHVSHISHVTPYVATAASPYIGHHYGLHPYDSLLLRR